MDSDKAIYTKLSKNIRTLRASYSETAQTLSDIAGVTLAAISNYETGRRVPDRTVLIKIAQHYRITVDELLYGDIVNIPLEDERYEKEEQKNRIRLLFPFVSSKKALENESFRKAYELHETLINALADDTGDIQNILETCYDLYSASQAQVTESHANMLGLLAMSGMQFSVCSKEASAYFQDYKRNRVSSLDIMKALYLRDPSFEDASEIRENEEARRDFLKHYGAEMLSHMRHLKQYQSFVDIADFYLAILYLFNLMDNSLEPQSNAMIGTELLSTFWDMNNVFVSRLVEEL